MTRQLSEPYGLFRDGPFRPLYADGRGFRKPKRDDEISPWAFRNEESARFMARRLDRPGFGRVFVEPLREIKSRIKREQLSNDPRFRHEVLLTSYMLNEGE